ncbi:Kinesin-1-like protein PSS1 [Acorus calamus]|uniref:Kinesin-like protein n=1 Tax=Acorus calamus TaxID=4465 RepID=A0AAV9F4U1_ACOCL|nr:Kinesin-1-like protein PSS1 [Acorus calamus]
MSNVTVCVRFRPLSARERNAHGEAICITSLDEKSFSFKDDKEEKSMFCFDRVFYPGSSQLEVYEFISMPIIQDIMNATNGTIFTYGQTGAGKTYSMERPNFPDSQEKGLLPRVVDGLFGSLRSSDEVHCTVKLSMVEIYMEKIRDLLDLAKDNLQILESKVQGIYLSEVTEIAVMDPADALKCLSRGISNRAVGETQMNMASSRSHCIYIFIAQQESTKDGMVKTGKLMLVDLAGSEKVEKTNAQGKVLEEAKSINKSLSSLGKVINALTTGRMNHIPYRDSKLTRILQDGLGGNSRTALLCCCSPSSTDASESLSTLRFGTRTKYLKTPLHVNMNEDKSKSDQVIQHGVGSESHERILNRLRQNMTEEDVNLLEQLFVLEGIFFDPKSISAAELEDMAMKTITELQQAVGELKDTNLKLQRENRILKRKLLARQELLRRCARYYVEDQHFLVKIYRLFNSFWAWLLN